MICRTFLVWEISVFWVFIKHFNNQKRINVHISCLLYTPHHLSTRKTHWLFAMRKNDDFNWMNCLQNHIPNTGNSKKLHALCHPPNKLARKNVAFPITAKEYEYQNKTRIHIYNHIHRLLWRVWWWRRDEWKGVS